MKEKKKKWYWQFLDFFELLPFYLLLTVWLV